MCSVSDPATIEVVLLCQVQEWKPGEGVDKFSQFRLAAHTHSFFKVLLCHVK